MTLRAAIEMPPVLPPQPPTFSPSTWQIMAQQVNADWQAALNTPPPGGYNAQDYLRQAGQFLQQHATAVYVGAAVLLALAFLGARRK